MLKRLTEECGSVLMEFIIVMPIYFLLLGSTFVVGELALHSIHLAASGDRTVAFAYRLDANFWRQLKQVMSLDRNALANRSAEAPDYSYAGDVVYDGRAAVSEFAESKPEEKNNVLPSARGHWTEAVAGRAVDNYTLTPLTRGLVSHWYHGMEKRVYETGMMTEQFDPVEKGGVGEMLDKDKSSLGRTLVKGNYYEDNDGIKLRDYGYFSLRRTDQARSISYRNLTPRELARADWMKAAVRPSSGSDIPNDKYESTASVNCDPDLYVAESSRGVELRQPGGSGTADSAVEYKYRDETTADRLYGFK